MTTLSEAERDLKERARELADVRRRVESLRAEASGRRLDGKDARLVVNEVRMVEETEARLQDEYDKAEATIPPLREQAHAAWLAALYPGTAEMLRRYSKVLSARRSLAAAEQALEPYLPGGTEAGELQTLRSNLSSAQAPYETTIYPATGHVDPKKVDAESRRFDALAEQAGRDLEVLTKRA
jgi:hypothetical protein